MILSSPFIIEGYPISFCSVLIRGPYNQKGNRVPRTWRIGVQGLGLGEPWNALALETALRIDAPKLAKASCHDSQDVYTVCTRGTGLTTNTLFLRGRSYVPNLLKACPNPFKLLSPLYIRLLGLAPCFNYCERPVGFRHVKLVDSCGCVWACASTYCKGLDH